MAINNQTLVDVVDPPFQNNGPTLDFGRIALRAMCPTKIMCRNLRVLNRTPAFRVMPQA